jgi:hypothetical protein
MNPFLLVAASGFPRLDLVGLRLWWRCPDGRGGFSQPAKHVCVSSAMGPSVPLMISGPDVRFPLRAEVQLDFEDADTRDRVARWMAGLEGAFCESTAPRWHWSTVDDAWWLEALESDGALNSWGYNHRGVVCTRGTKVIEAVPALFSVDPRDEERLPDGSRQVDALALAITAVHLGSRR